MPVQCDLSFLAQVMNDSIDRGLATDGILPGGLNVRRRAKSMREKLEKRRRTSTPMDWMSAYAIAVNEENAAGGRVVTGDPTPLLLRCVFSDCVGSAHQRSGRNHSGGAALLHGDERRLVGPRHARVPGTRKQRGSVCVTLGWLFKKRVWRRRWG